MTMNVSVIIGGKADEAVKAANDAAAAVENFGRRSAGAGAQAAGAGKAVKLTSQEVSNLGYQFNDLFTQLSTGQSPFTAMMQQGMQIGQVLGPKGAAGAIKALGTGLAAFLLNPVNLAVIGFAALASVATSAIDKLNAGLPSIEERLKAQKDLLADVAQSFGSYGAAVARIAPADPVVVKWRLEMDLAASREALMKQAQDLLREISPRYFPNGGRGAIQVNTQNLPFKPAIDELLAAVKAGDPDIERFQRRIAEIATATGASETVKTLAKAISDNVTKLAEAQRQTEAMEKANTALASSYRGLGSAMSLMGAAPTLGTMRSFVPDLTPDRDRLKMTADMLLANARTMSEVKTITDLLAEADARYNAELTKGATLHRLELAAITAKSPAQKAEIAAQRERASAINTSADAAMVEVRAQNAAAIAYAQATFAITEQNRQRVQAAGEAVGSVELEISLLGKSAGQAAEMRANWQSYLDLRRMAEENGVAFDAAQYQRLKGINAELGRQTDLLNQQQLLLQLQQEAHAATLNPADANIYRRLTGMGIAEGTAEWNQLAAAIRQADAAAKKAGFIADLAQTGRSIFEGFASDIRNGSSLLDAFANAAIKAGDAIAKMFLDMASNTLFGSGGSGGGLLGNLLGNLFSGGPAPSLYATGAAFAGGNVLAFAGGGVVSQPTYFPMSGGRTGLMGEAGAEAIMPLRRLANGRLGVESAGGAMALTYAPSVTVNGNGDLRLIADLLDRQRREFERRLPDQIRDARRRGQV